MSRNTNIVVVFSGVLVILDNAPMTEPLSVPLSSQPVTISHNNSCRGVWDIWVSCWRTCSIGSSSTPTIYSRG